MNGVQFQERPRRKDTRTAERPDALLEADEPLMYRGKLAIQSDTVLKEIPDMESVKNAFLVVTGRQSVSVAAETPKEKREWTTHLRNAIASVVGPPTPASEMCVLALDVFTYHFSFLFLGWRGDVCW